MDVGDELTAQANRFAADRAEFEGEMLRRPPSERLRNLRTEVVDAYAADWNVLLASQHGSRSGSFSVQETYEIFDLESFKADGKAAPDRKPRPGSFGEATIDMFVDLEALSSDYQIIFLDKIEKSQVIPPFLAGCISRIHAAIFSFWAGVMPPMPMFGRSLF